MDEYELMRIAEEYALEWTDSTLAVSQSVSYHREHAIVLVYGKKAGKTREEHNVAFDANTGKFRYLQSLG